MEFRTMTKIPPYPFRISHSDNIMLVGSCFADNIGERLRFSLFPVEVNPFGVMYNPASICQTMARIASGTVPAENELINHCGCYHSFDFSSTFSSSDPRKSLSLMGDTVLNINRKLNSTNIFILTFGTSAVYEYSPSRKIVANCHKIPATNFNFRHLSINEIEKYIRSTTEIIFKANPSAKIILTVSPVRYIQYGLHESNLSKARLLLAIDNLIDDKKIFYFPAYEIVNDELRDYRFFDRDMVHPSSEAVDYIFEIFSKSFFSDETLALNKLCRKLVSRTQHRFLTDNPEEIARFKESTVAEAEKLSSNYPFLEPQIKKILK